MKPPFATDREKHIHMARIFIEQARATSIPSRAAARRRMAQVKRQESNQMEMFG